MPRSTGSTPCARTSSASPSSRTSCSAASTKFSRGSEPASACLCVGDEVETPTARRVAGEVGLEIAAIVEGEAGRRDDRAKRHEMGRIARDIHAGGGERVVDELHDGGEIELGH